MKQIAPPSIPGARGIHEEPTMTHYGVAPGNSSSTSDRTALVISKYGVALIVDVRPCCVIVTNAGSDMGKTHHEATCTGERGRNGTFAHLVDEFVLPSVDDRDR